MAVLRDLAAADNCSQRRRPPYLLNTGLGNHDRGHRDDDERCRRADWYTAGIAGLSAVDTGSFLSRRQTSICMQNRRITPVLGRHAVNDRGGSPSAVRNSTISMAAVECNPELQR